mmetsp:Transcript_72692/g.132957  ORF Transcript_72692/g.132957 Transcript_72692/m.132957 type:complete len:265 (-) Transcript_72692:173-967(-)
MDGAAVDTSEYLCTLQLPDGSLLAQDLNERRTRCKAKMGADETVLYPLHVTVTGFFAATSEQASQIAAAAANLVRSATPGALHVDMRQVLATDDGHVLLDVVAPGIAKLALALAAEAKHLGILLRPKHVRHLSLAKRRSAAEREQIVKLYNDVSLGHCPLDLVISRLLRRSDVEKLRLHGEAHAFSDLLRMRVPVAADLRLRNPMCVSTPLRKRPSEPRPAEEDAVRPKLTPPKVPKELAARCCTEDALKAPSLAIERCGEGAC